MQPTLRFALRRDDDRSVVLDDEPSELDAMRWRRRLPAIGETVTVGGYRGTVCSVASKQVGGDQDGSEARLEVEVLIDPDV